MYSLIITTPSFLSHPGPPTFGPGSLMGRRKANTDTTHNGKHNFPICPSMNKTCHFVSDMTSYLSIFDFTISSNFVHLPLVRETEVETRRGRGRGGGGAVSRGGIQRRGGARGGRRQSPTPPPSGSEVNKTSQSVPVDEVCPNVPPSRVEASTNAVNVNGVGGSSKTLGTNSACDKDEVNSNYFFQTPSST